MHAKELIHISVGPAFAAAVSVSSYVSLLVDSEVHVHLVSIPTDTYCLFVSTSAELPEI